MSRLHLALGLSAASLLLAACGRGERASNDSDAVRQRAVEVQPLGGMTGAEQQERALNSVIRAIYVCADGESLTVDFDNRRDMATVRDTRGLAVDLHRRRAEDGLWYVASGHELKGRDGQATWTAPPREPTQCRAVD